MNKGNGKQDMVSEHNSDIKSGLWPNGGQLLWYCSFVFFPKLKG